VQAKLALTNTVPTAAYRGAGRPVSSYAIERLVDQAAYELGMDPAEFRRRNLVARDRFPYRIATGFEYDCGDFEGVLDKALKAAEWNSFETRRAESRRRGRLRGQGHRQLHRGERRGRLRAIRPGSDHVGRRGTRHLARDIAFPRPGPRNDVRADRFRRARRADGVDPAAHRRPGSCSWSAIPREARARCWAWKRDADGVAGRSSGEVSRFAAEELEAAPADVEFLEGKYRIKGTDREVALAALARKHPGRSTWT